MKAVVGDIFNDDDLAQARRLNRLLSFLPRYQTGRRWNARLVQGVLTVAQLVVPDVRRLRRRVSVIEIPDLSTRIRVVRPDTVPQAMLVHFHGGAWVLGNARLEDRLAASMARECGLVVAVVEFRNAIDDDLASTVQECSAVTEWLADNLQRFGVQDLFLSGESSGAHLAVEALLHLRSVGKHDNVLGFYSVCGGFDLTGSPSLRANSRRSLLIDDRSALANLARLTLSLPADRARGPLHADLHDLPPALFIAASLDPILDDSIEMSAKWQKENGNAESLIVPEAPHGFNRFPTSLAAKTNRFGRDWMNNVLSQRKTERAGNVGAKPM
ncbi:alpha/beta hydrolase [Rhizobium terrae]|uniref:alpha/beta hydrolase n=1 Tax=Rhizobium terrae TaxID=2171756 RepID=UPI000E3ECAC5|nr:alpha/beta hydrolase [Rhizobium terrae]